MSTYSHAFSILWGTDSAPVSLAVIDAAGVEHTPTLTTAITESPAGGGRYKAVATLDTAWGAVKDWWYDADGNPNPGDGPPPVSVVMVGQLPAALDTGGGSGGSGTGSGDFAVDHDGGDGVTVDGEAATTDCMRFTASGVGVDNVEIAAYLASDYAAGTRGASDRRGTTYTGTDGRWQSPLMLDDGTYTIVASKGGYLIQTLAVVVP